jgi:glycosyltransferase involved in cell wall biosynthesis
MVLANRFDEQPRVIFDSFSQGVPVISSATQGVLDIVAPEETALVFPVNNAEAMARNMLRFATDRTLQAEMSEAALAAGRGHTHRRMHVARAAYLAGIFPKSFEAACPNMDKKQFEQRHPDAD